VNDALMKVLLVERRVDPYFRDGFDRVLRPPIQSVVQALINLKRKPTALGLAEEQVLPDEEEITRAIIEQMTRFTKHHYAHGRAERAGNTKTYGVVRGEFSVLAGLPDHLRRGVFATESTFRAWVRFAGPGPLAPPDLDDNGVLSIGLKLMGVPGPKLLDDENMTQDFTGISSPTFTTPNIVENLKLQRQVFAGTPVLYFVDPFDSHYLDGIMQGLYARTHTNPLEVQYYSCVPYLLGEGQAVHYSMKPTGPATSKVPRHPSDNYLRAAMVERLRAGEVHFDFMVQLQTDPRRMPIEDASVVWPEKLSPFVTVARLRLPAQEFDSVEQLGFADNLSFNPWHSLAAHRPLGNQNRARKAIYRELSMLRQAMNGVPHVEPTGDEVFPARQTPSTASTPAADGGP
jgi:hypothetical protein